MNLHNTEFPWTFIFSTVSSSGIKYGWYYLFHTHSILFQQLPLSKSPSFCLAKAVASYFKALSPALISSLGNFPPKKTNMIIHTSAFVHNFPIASNRIKHCTQISLCAFQFLINVKARDQETESLLSADSLPLNTPNSHSWARTRKSKQHNPGFPKGGRFFSSYLAQCTLGGSGSKES